MSRFPLCLLVLAAVTAASAQTPFHVPVDTTATCNFAHADHFFREEKWSEAVATVQSLLDQEGDGQVETVQPGLMGNPVTVLKSAKAEAERRLQFLPPRARELYQKEYGRAAAELLAVALRKNDPDLLAVVAARFLWTDAGAEAVEHIVNQNARTNITVAALASLKLMQRVEPEIVSSETLLEAARALFQSGDEGGYARVRKVLTDRNLLTAKWQREIEAAGTKRQEWGVFPQVSLVARGNLARTGQTFGSSPFLVERWHRETARSERTKQALEPAFKSAASRGIITLPPSFPLFADGKVIYRAWDGIYAADAMSGDLRWHTAENSKWSFERVASEGSKWQTVNKWFTQYVGVGYPQVAFSNSMTGTISADDWHVYAIEDLPIPPFNINNQPVILSPSDLEKAVQGNRLQAYQINSGKLIWELGGEWFNKDQPDPSKTFFLGAPLPVDGTVYVLNEKDKEVRLLAIDPKRSHVQWKHPLGSVRSGALTDPFRRVEAAHLAYSEGVLVCPTNAGAVVAVDPLARRTLWTHQYEVPAQRPYDPWKSSAAIIKDGRVFVAPMDRDELLCLRLLDGTALWAEESRRGDQFVAGVFGDLILVVGSNACRAVNVKDGKELWKVETGAPLGMGAAGRGQYFLPVKTADGSEVCVIDLVKGVATERLQLGKQQTLGNLMFIDGQMVSQSFWEVRAFPLLNTLTATTAARLMKDPNDPEALSERARLHRYNGDLAAAVADLDAALAAKPDESLRMTIQVRLFDTLTDYLRKDFGKAEKHLETCFQLGQPIIPGRATDARITQAHEESRRRHSVYWQVVAEGREKQGKSLDALKAFLEFAQDGDLDELVPASGDPKRTVSRASLVSARIADLIGKAGPEDRKTIDDELDRRWKAIRDTNDTDKMKRLLRVIGGK